MTDSSQRSCSQLSFRHEVPLEPVTSELRYVLERPGVVKQMCGARDHSVVGRDSQVAACLKVELEYEFVLTADDQQNRSADIGQHGSCEVRSSTR